MHSYLCIAESGAHSSASPPYRIGGWGNMWSFSGWMDEWMNGLIDGSINVTLDDLLVLTSIVQ